MLLDACPSGHITQDLLVRNDALAHDLVDKQRAGAVVFAASKGRQRSFEPEQAREVALVTIDAPGPRDTVEVPQLADDHGVFTSASVHDMLTQLRASRPDDSLNRHTHRGADPTAVHGPFGRYTCTAKKSACGACPMHEICPRIGVSA